MIKLSVKQIADLVRGTIIAGKAKGKIRGVSIDSRKIEKGNLFIALMGENFDGHKFLKAALKNANAAVVEKRITLKTQKPVILVKDSLAALQEIAAYWRIKISPKVISVTGSCGKTTTKDLIAYILKEKLKVVAAKKSFNNYIGVPLTVFEANQKTEALVLEMETNEIGGISKLCGISQPNIGIITGVGDTHLQFLKNRYNVFKEKSEIINGVGASGSIILNADSPYAEKMKKLVRGKLITYSLKKNADFTAEIIRSDLNGVFFKTAGEKFRIRIPGNFNVSNALAAIATARTIGISWNTIKKRLKTFTPQKGRTTIKKIRGTTLIDDSYNANPESVKALCEIIEKLKGRKILVFGDMLELGEKSKKLHEAAGSRFAMVGISKIFYKGNFAKNFISGALKKNPNILAEAFDSPKKVAKRIRREKADFIIFKGSRKMKIDEVLNYVSDNLSSRPR